jgi:MraZ protein
MAGGAQAGASMALLVGRHVNRIDKKGRVSVPKAFREAYAGQGFAGVYAYPLFKYPAIEACGEAFMRRLGESMDEGMDMFSDEQDDLAAIVMNNAEALPFDPEGRVVLPKPFLDHAGLTTEAVFVGRGQRFQIWEPAAFAAQNRKAFERARARGATLRLKPLQGEGEGA